MQSGIQGDVGADGYMRVPEVMAHLRLSRSSVYKLMGSGQLAYSKFG